MTETQEPGLNTDTFLVREHVGMFKLHEAYDLLDAQGRPIGVALERASGWRQFLKLFVGKNMLPFTVEILSTEERVLLSITRGFSILRSKVFVHSAEGECIGSFRQRLLSLGGAFDIFDANDQQIASLKGDWKGWNYSFKDPAGTEIGTVSRQWGGVAKELFTSADNYVVHIHRDRIRDPRLGDLLLGAALCIDMVLKESGGGGGVSLFE